MKVANKKRFLSLLLCCLTIALLFTACTPAGGGETEKATSDQTEKKDPPKGPDGTTEKKDPPTPPAVVYGNEIGDNCYRMDIPVITDDPTGYTGVFNLSDNAGKITVLNFWYTECVPCTGEMPHFASLAQAYADSVRVVAMHAQDNRNAWEYQSLLYIEEHYEGSSIVFGYDRENAYYTKLGGNGPYPLTLILDEDGVIVYKINKSISYETLESVIRQLLNN